MKRKLIWLNVVLVAAIAATAWRVRDEWTAQQAREQAIRTARVPPSKVALPVIPPPPSGVTAASYGEIANKMLFSRERNPTVVVEVPIQPPPKPMPPLPVLHGVLGLPSGTVALMSVDAKSPGKAVKEGEKIGEFELTNVSRDEISLKWEDKTVTRSVSEMIYQAIEKAPPSQQLASAAAPGAGAPAPAAVAKPSVDVGGNNEGMKMCSPGDTSPAGTVADGYRKVLVNTPFGSSCHWEPVK